MCAARRSKLPLLYPTHRLEKGSYATDPPRVYRIDDRNHHSYNAYRIVVDANMIGQYYGVQGMGWRTPPILSGPSQTRVIGGRRFSLYYDGTKLRIVALRTAHGVYWVSNTLSELLTNRQMLDIAASLRRARR